MRVWFCLFLALFALTGCGKDYSKSIAEFSKAVETSTSALKSYYYGINRFERDMYFENLRLRPEKAAEILGNKKVEGLLSEEDLQKRLDALRLLNEYALQLGLLASSNAPAETGENIRVIGNKIEKLQTRFGEDSAYYKPLSDLFALGFEEGFKIKQRQEIKKAICSKKDDSDPVLKILQLFREELLHRELQEYDDYNRIVTQKAINYTQNSPCAVSCSQVCNEDSFSSICIDCVKANKECKETVQERNIRIARLKDLQETIERRQLTMEANPTSLVNKMENSYQELRIYTCDKKQSIDELLNALSEFTDSSQSFANAVKALREAER